MHISFDFLLSRSAEADPCGANVVLPLLLYRTALGQKVNTASKCFSLYYLTATWDALKTTFFSKRSPFPIFMCRRAWKKRLPLFRSRRSFCVFTFYFISRISSSLTSSVGLPAASSLFRKDSIAAVSSRCSARVSARTIFFRRNITHHRSKQNGERQWPHLAAFDL